MRRVLDALLAGQDPPVTQTKVFGCSIKWSDKAGDVERYWEQYRAEPVTLEPVGAEGLKQLGANQSDPVENRKLRLVNYRLMKAFDEAWSGALPFTLLIDTEGKVLYRKESPFDALQLKRIIVGELNRRKPW